MKRKIAFAFCLILVVSITTYVGAKSVESSIGYNEIVNFIKYDTESNCHSAIRSTNVLEGPITVENTLQRKNSKGSWENVGRAYYTMTKADQTIEKEFNLIYGTADTRTIWVNQTKNSFLQGRFYLNNGPNTN